MVARGILVDVPQLVRVRTETGGKPAEDGQQLIVVGSQLVRPGSATCVNEKFPRTRCRVDRLNEPELPAVGAAEAEHQMIRQPGLQPEPGFRHVRRVQIIGDGVEPAAGAARPRCGQRQSDLVWLQRWSPFRSFQRWTDPARPCGSPKLR